MVMFLRDTPTEEMKTIFDKKMHMQLSKVHDILLISRAKMALQDGQALSLPFLHTLTCHLLTLRVAELEVVESASYKKVGSLCFELGGVSASSAASAA